MAKSISFRNGANLVFEPKKRADVMWVTDHELGTTLLCHLINISVVSYLSMAYLAIRSQHGLVGV